MDREQDSRFAERLLMAVAICQQRSCEALGFWAPYSAGAGGWHGRDIAAGLIAALSAIPTYDGHEWARFRIQ